MDGQFPRVGDRVNAMSTIASDWSSIASGLSKATCNRSHRVFAESFPVRAAKSPDGTAWRALQVLQAFKWFIKPFELTMLTFRMQLLALANRVSETIRAEQIPGKSLLVAVFIGRRSQ